MTSNIFKMQYYYQHTLYSKAVWPSRNNYYVTKKVKVKVKLKVKCTPVQALRLCSGRTAHRRSRGITLLFLGHDTRRGEGSESRPGRSLTPGKTRYPLYRRLGGPQGRSGQVRKISPPPGFDPRTVQPVASRYTDYATRPITEKVRFFKCHIPNDVA